MTVGSASYAQRSMVTITPIHERLWKVTAGKELAGYIDAVNARDGTRYRARRLNVQYRRWVSLGEYWELEAAVEALSGYER